jgi:hypothetical protein
MTSIGTCRPGAATHVMNDNMGCAVNWQIMA